MATPYGRGWLDLQRYAMTALTGLGPEYQAARGIVREALARLLVDLPSLPDQALMDDSPTANRQTRDWLQAEGILDGEGVAGPSVQASATGGAAASSAIVARARGLARKGEAAKAVELLLGEAERSRHPRDAFLHRTEAAAIMLDSGMDAVARPILDDMMKQIEDHSLDAWEAGDVVARPLVLLFRVKKAAGKKTDDLYERIIRLDPVQAVQLQQEEQTKGEDDSSNGNDTAAKKAAARKAAAKKEKAEDDGEES
jgi:type VI secretion system protein ImpA